jgi:hypothetical protein
MGTAKTGRKAEQVTEDGKTWRDYLPPLVATPTLITRAELLAQVPQWSADVSERTLRFWETEGVLPRAVRQKHHSVVQAVYPSWFVLVVAAVYHHRQHGWSLPAIAAEMPTIIQNFALMQWAFENNVIPLDDSTPGGTDLIPPLRAVARIGSTPERPVTRITISLADKDGEVIANLLWFTPEGVLSDGTSSELPSDSRLSDGSPASVPADSD